MGLFSHVYMSMFDPISAPGILGCARWSLSSCGSGHNSEWCSRLQQKVCGCWWVGANCWGKPMVNHLSYDKSGSFPQLGSNWAINVGEIELCQEKWTNSYNSNYIYILSGGQFCPWPLMVGLFCFRSQGIWRVPSFASMACHWRDRIVAVYQFGFEETTKRAEVRHFKQKLKLGVNIFGKSKLFVCTSKGKSNVSNSHLRSSWHWQNLPWPINC